MSHHGMCWDLRLRAQGCKFDDITVANAAEHGRRDLLKWCYGQPGGCCWPAHLPVYELAAANGEPAAASFQQSQRTTLHPEMCTKLVGLYTTQQVHLFSTSNRLWSVKLTYHANALFS